MPIKRHIRDRDTEVQNPDDNSTAQRRSKMWYFVNMCINFIDSHICTAASCYLRSKGYKKITVFLEL